MLFLDDSLPDLNPEAGFYLEAYVPPTAVPSIFHTTKPEDFHTYLAMDRDSQSRHRFLKVCDDIDRRSRLGYFGPLFSHGTHRQR